ncbi:LysM peptidoglycan-binding domain-containing protein, partial [Pedococcus sp. 2YAF34]|uniref:LysM peptidoglycan-binding domain-containing protein n=1 Tax=Pedococcus sp. 2YAF34 TaxID=3233032 RepID=UPI003F946235
GWTPTRPVQRPQAPVEVLGLRPGARATADEVVVHRGDTLWSIVARQLGPEASDAEVAAAWPAWHEANRSVIGDDPDLLVPGQQLRAPAATVSAR